MNSKTICAQKLANMLHRLNIGVVDYDNWLFVNWLMKMHDGWYSVMDSRKTRNSNS